MESRKNRKNIFFTLRIYCYRFRSRKTPREGPIVYRKWRFLRRQHHRQVWWGVFWQSYFSPRDVTPWTRLVVCILTIILYTRVMSHHRRGGWDVFWHSYSTPAWHHAIDEVGWVYSDIHTLHPRDVTPWIRWVRCILTFILYTRVTSHNRRGGWGVVWHTLYPRDVTP